MSANLLDNRHGKDHTRVMNTDQYYDGADIGFDGFSDRRPGTLDASLTDNALRECGAAWDSDDPGLAPDRCWWL